MVYNSAEMQDDDDPMGLKWLFDPRRIDHLAIKDQLSFYKHRDLIKGKVYNMGKKIWGRSTTKVR